MIVLKFGGTSLADGARIAEAARRVEESGSEPRLVVASAMAGVTDVLQELGRQAVRGERETVLERLARLEQDHRRALQDLQLVGDQAEQHFDEHLRDLRIILRGLRHLGRDDPRTMDAVLTFGELFSAELLAGRLRRIGVPVRCLDPREVLVTEERYGGARPDLEATRLRAGTSLRPVLDAAQVAVIGGFLGASPSGATTHLGRGGSDLSASVLAAALGADRVEIWTDVSGMMSADPCLVPEARPLSRVTFSEATVLARFGARVLHPDTVAPAVRAGIPVVIRNSLQPTDPGTAIEADGPANGNLRALACRAPVGLVRLRRSHAMATSSTVREALSRIEECGLRPDLVTTSEATLVLLLDQEELQAAREILTSMGEVEVIADLGVVCAVGAGSLAFEVMSRLAGERILLSWGGTDGPEVSVVVPAERTRDLMRELHRDLIEADAGNVAGKR